MISVEEALSIIAASEVKVKVEKRPLKDALGYVLS
jgi:hypothetical protein